MINTYIIGKTLEEARQQSWFVDSKGLITSDRKNLEAHKQHYAHDVKGVLGEEGFKQFKEETDVTKLIDAVKLIKPTAIIGVSAQGNQQHYTTSTIEYY